MPPSSEPRCPFCRRIADGDVDATSDHAAAFEDLYPLNPGHVLVVPTRHVADLYDLDPTERAGVWVLVDQVALDLRGSVDGLNIGVNIGETAGQTVDHAHVHVVPRHHGDVADPRGGVRWVIPERAAYWDARPVFDVVWERITDLAGETFTQKRGGTFTYMVEGNALRPDRTNHLLARSHVEEAYTLVPLDTVAPLQHLRGPSYLYAILMDPRVRHGDW